MEQAQHKDGIYTVGECREWVIKIDKEYIFNQVSLISLYETHKEVDQEKNRDIHIIMDDDKCIFNIYLKSAVAKLTELLARRIEEVNSVLNKDEDIEYKLLVSNNHSEHLLSPLKTYCEDFLVQYVLMKWYKREFNMDEAERNIVKCLMFRKKSASVKVRNLL